MSLNYLQPLKTQMCDFPQTDVNGDKDAIVVYRGGKDIYYYSLSPQGGGESSAGSTDFQFYLPSRQTVLDKIVWITGTMEVTVNSSAALNIVGSQYLLKAGEFGPQALPCNHAISTVTLDVDGTVWSMNNGEVFPILKYFNYTVEELKSYSSMTPSLLDNSIFYVKGTANNVLATQDTVTYNQIPSRGAYPFSGYTNPVSLAAGPATNATIKFKFAEPIMLSPLELANSSEDFGLVGMSNIKIKLIWYSLADCFSRCFKITNLVSDVANNYDTLGSDGNISAAAPYARKTGSNLPLGGTVNFTGLKLFVGQYSLQEVQIPKSINSYGWTNITYFRDQQTELAPARVGTGLPSTFMMTSSTFQLAQVPTSVIIAILPNGASILNNITIAPAVPPVAAIQNPPWSHGDTFFPISAINNITFGNRSGLLTSWNAEFLYLTSVRNGLKHISYTNSGMHGNLIATTEIVDGQGKIRIPQGCPIKLKIGKDIPLNDSTLAPGVSQNTNFQYQITGLNYFLQPQTVLLYTIFLYDGIFTISASSGSSYVIAPLSREDVISTTDHIPYEDIDDAPSYVGQGNVFNRLKRIGRKTAKFLNRSDVKDLIKRGIDVYDTFGGPGAELLKTGYNAADDLQRLSGHGALVAGGAAVGGRLVNSSMHGGAAMTAADLRRRLGK